MYAYEVYATYAAKSENVNVNEIAEQHVQGSSLPESGFDPGPGFDAYKDVLENTHSAPVLLSASVIVMPSAPSSVSTSASKSRLKLMLKLTSVTSGFGS